MYALTTAIIFISALILSTQSHTLGHVDDNTSYVKPVILTHLDEGPRSRHSRRERTPDPTRYYLDPAQSHVEWNHPNHTQVGSTTVATVHVSNRVLPQMVLSSLLDPCICLPV